MDTRTVSPDLSVSSQITQDDVGVAAANGFRAIIINRPDGEDSGQPTHKDIEAAAERHGLDIRYVPVESGNITQPDVAAFAAAMNELPAPVLAYCGSGKRSASLWALAQARHHSIAAILEATSDAGYDLSDMRDRLEQASEVNQQG